MPKRNRSPSPSSSERTNDGHDLLPEASKERYTQVFDAFLEHANIKRHKNGNCSRRPKEKDFIKFLVEKQEQGFKNSTLWSYYSMLGACAEIEWNLKLKDEFPRVSKLLKKWDKSYVRKKAKTFSEADLDKYLALPVPKDNEREVILRKCAVVLSLCGGLRSCELRALSVGDIVEDSDGMTVTFRGAKQRGEAGERLFRVLKSSEGYRHVQQHLKLLFEDGWKEGPLFRGLNKNKTKFTVHPMGKNYLYDIPKRVAETLKLPDSKQFTSHAMRRTAATVAAENGATDAQLKRHFGWTSQKTASRYIDNTTRAATEMAKILQPGTVTASVTPSVAAPTPVTPMAASQQHDVNIRLTIEVKQLQACTCKASLD